MSDAKENTEMSKEQIIAILIEQSNVRAILADKLGIAYPDNDPDLAVVEIHNALLEKMAENFTHFLKVFKECLIESTDLSVKKVQDSTDTLQKTLSNVTIKGITEAVSEFREESAKLITAFRIHTAIIAVCTLVFCGTLAFWAIKAVK